MAARGRSQPLGLQVEGDVYCPPGLWLPVFLTLRSTVCPGNQLDFPKLGSFALLSLPSLDSGIYGHAIPSCSMSLWFGPFVSVQGL